MSGDHAGRGRSAPNTLPDQAIPNVLPPAEVHVAPTRGTDEVDDDRPARAERGEQPAATTPGEGVELERVVARLRALAQSFATRSEAVEARLLEGFQEEAAPLAAQYGDLVIRDADDERISFRADGSFSGEVVPEDAPTSWRPLETALDIVEFYDPSDLFADLADRLAAAHPNVGNLSVEDAGPRLRQLAEAFAERSASTRHRAEAAEVGLIERFEEAAAPFTRKLGDIIFLDDADERLTLGRDGRLLAEVIPEDDETSWRTLRTSQQVTEFYSPEDLFRALAEELERAFPEGADEGAEVAADALHDLALVWREQSLDAEARLFAEFNRAAKALARTLGGFAIVDDDDEQLIVDGDGQLLAHVLDRSTGAWRDLATPDELVESYDPTDVFADLADALADAFPALTVPKHANEEPEAPQVASEDPPGLWYPGSWSSAWLPGVEDLPVNRGLVPRPIKISAPVSANPAGRRDALIGMSPAGSGGEPEDESAVDRLILSRLGPTLLAVAAALVSTPFVATAIVTMSASPSGPELDGGPPPIDFAHAVPIALVAVVTAGLIGGAIGGRFVRRAPLSALLLAVAIAWPVAIATLPIVPTLQGEPYATGYFCFDVCTPEIRSGDLLSGLTAYGGSVLAGIISILTATMAIVLAIGAWVARRRDHARVAAVLGLAAYGSFNLVSVLGRTGGGLPFLCLVVGAVIWVAPYWARWERVRPRAATAAGPPAPLVS